jgi:uncharacterized protein (TIGR03435 family)
LKLNPQRATLDVLIIDSIDRPGVTPGVGPGVTPGVGPGVGPGVTPDPTPQGEPTVRAKRQNDTLSELPVKNPALMTGACAGLMLTLLAGLAPTPPLAAQASPAPAAGPTFEVASVKPNKSGDQRAMLSLPPTGRLTATNVPLRLLLRQAFDVQDFQLVGGPSWVNTDRFDIVAKAPDGVTDQNQIRPMLLALFADRFKLVTHTETREMPIYSLVLARSDGRLGPKLSVTKVDCAAMFSGRRGAPLPPPPPAPAQLPPPIECGVTIGTGMMNVGGMAMLEFARALSQFAGRIVLDRTGLKERYSFQLQYAPEGRGFGPGPGLGPAGPEPAAVDPNIPSLFTALQEQLGLKLESDKAPIDVIVIDRIEQPIED